MADVNTIVAQLNSSLASLNTTITKFESTADDLTRSLQGLVKESGKTTKQVGDLALTMKDAEEEYLDEILLKKKHADITEEDIELAKKQAASKRALMYQEKKLQDLRERQARGEYVARGRLATQEALVTRAQARHAQVMGTGGGGRGLIGTVATFGKSMMNFIRIVQGPLLFIIGILVGQYQKQKDLMEKSSGILEKELGPSFLLASDRMRYFTYQTGLASDALLESIMANRQAVNAIGGTSATITKWTDDTKMQFTAMTGDVDKGFRLMLESEALLRRSGIKPTTDSLIRYGTEVQRLSAMTGMATAEINSMFHEVASDTESLVLLRAAREGEREAILASQRALISMNIAAGMTAEQAKDAAKMLNKMVAAKPLDRIKQAARVRALGGAMGIAGSEEAARAIMAGPRATAEQKRQLMDFSKSATNMVDQMRGAGLGQEIFAMTMLEKLDLEQYYGPGSSFSTTLAGSLQQQTKDFVKAQDDAATRVMIGIQEAANKAMSAIQGEGLLTMVTKIYEWLTSSWLSKVFGGSKEARAAEVKRSQETGAGKYASLAGEAAVEAEYIPGKSTQAAGTSAAREMKEKQQQQTDDTKMIAASSAKTSQGIDNQLKSMNNTNEILMRIHANSEKQVELAEKQLTAMTLTDEEKKRDTYRRRILEGNQFVSRYGYTP